MAPPAVVYVVAAVVGVAAVFAFKEFVYEPHIAPTFEVWAEEFLERRRAARNRRASAVPVRASRRRSSSSDSPSHSNDTQRYQGESERAPQPNDFSADGFELEALALREVDEWRNEVLRSQERKKDVLRKRRTNRPSDDFDGFDTTSTTLDESFTSLTHTPLASTHVISNVSSPITPSTASLPQTPTHHLRSVSQSTMQVDVSTPFIAPRSPSPIREMPVMSPRESSPGFTVSTPRPPTGCVNHLDATSPFPIAIPMAGRQSPATEGVPHPLPFTPTYQIVTDDSPFGPLLPDTPRSSAEMYGERPFSPITRVMGSCSGSVAAAGSKGTLSSSIDSTTSARALRSSGVLRRPSGLVNEVVMSSSDDESDKEYYPHPSTSDHTLANPDPGANESIISSLSERYPAPPTPPVIITPPGSSVGVISTPSSPRSFSSEVVVHYSASSTELHSSSPLLSQTRPPLPLLKLPSESSSPRQISRSQSSTHSAASPAFSYASFLSPMPVSRAASESEGDEFLSIASDDSDWDASPATPGGRTGPVQDRTNNPFLDFEHVTRDARNGSSEHGDESEGSEVLVPDLGREVGSEVGSDESWGSARRH